MSKEDLVKIKIDILGKELSLKQAKEIYHQLDELFRFMPKTLDLYKYKEQNKKIKTINNIDTSKYKEQNKKIKTINNIDISKMSYN